MADAVEDHEGTVSNGGKTTTKRKKSVEISAEKTRLMANNTSGINKETKVNGLKLETVTCFKHPGPLTGVASLGHSPGQHKQQPH